jgi:hypothetical protein
MFRCACDRLVEALRRQEVLEQKREPPGFAHELVSVAAINALFNNDYITNCQVNNQSQSHVSCATPLADIESNYNVSFQGGTRVVSASHPVRLGTDMWILSGVGYDPGDVTATAWSLVPIPAAVWLFGSGLGLLGWFRRRQSV